MPNLKFAAPLPYPEPLTDENLQDAKLLLASYAGRASELTSTLGYLYQSFVTVGSELSRALEGIARCEMLHMKLLGQTIRRLGGYPVMGARTYWNGNFVDYTATPARFLAADIMAEEAAIANYERTILNLSSEGAKQVLERIILDEQQHIECLKELALNV